MSEPRWMSVDEFLAGRHLARDFRQTRDGGEKVERETGTKSNWALAQKAPLPDRQTSEDGE